MVWLRKLLSGRSLFLDDELAERCIAAHPLAVSGILRRAGERRCEELSMGDLHAPRKGNTMLAVNCAAFVLRVVVHGLATGGGAGLRRLLHRV